ARGGPPARPSCCGDQRRGQALFKGGVHGQAGGVGNGGGRLFRGDPDTRRLRLPGGVWSGKDLSRRPRLPDLRGHLRYPADGDRPRSLRGQGTSWSPLARRTTSELRTRRTVSRPARFIFSV